MLCLNYANPTTKNKSANRGKVYDLFLIPINSWDIMEFSWHKYNNLSQLVWFQLININVWKHSWKEGFIYPHVLHIVLFTHLIKYINHKNWIQHRPWCEYYDVCGLRYKNIPICMLYESDEAVAHFIENMVSLRDVTEWREGGVCKQLVFHHMVVLHYL